MTDDDWPQVGERVGPFVLRERLDLHCGERLYLADGERGPVELSMFVIHMDSGALFEREAELVLMTLRDLAHPRLRPIAAAGAHGPLCWIAAAPNDDVPLREWSVSRPWRQVLAVMREVGEALAALEPTGMPTDVIFPEDIRVASDGHARVDVALRLIVDRLRVGGLQGHRNIRYMSPERHRALAESESGPGPATTRSPRSTQHLFCVITWEALYGRYPFAYSNVVELILALVDGAVTDPPPDSNIPAPIHQALVRGLAGDPAARWPSMHALLAALEPPRGLLARLFGR